MLKNNGIFDPIERTRDMAESEFTKYTQINNQAAAEGVKTDPVVLERIMMKFKEAHRDAPQDDVSWVWSAVSKKIAENPGLAQFIEDYRGAESLYFFPRLVSVYRSPSEALEMSYGVGKGMSGEMVYRTDKNDPIEDFVKNDPTFVYNRERQMYVADLVTTIQKKGAPKSPTKVVDLGAGRLAWARYHGFSFDKKRQAIIAYDKDPTIDTKRLFPFTADDLGLTFVHGDLKRAFTNPACKDADLIMLGGVASYYPMEIFQSAVVMPVYGFLKKDGVFFFDLQVDCPYLWRSMSVFGWPRMNFYGDAAATIATVEQMRKSLWKSGMKFGAEYALDTYNEVPSSVMVTFTKINITSSL